MREIRQRDKSGRDDGEGEEVIAHFVSPLAVCDPT
jgi:hypothetical protein